MLKIPALLVACLTSVASVAHAEAEATLSYIDLRVQGGLEHSNGFGGAITLMGGELGPKGDMIIDAGDKIGLVLGFRAGAGRFKIDDATGQPFNLSRIGVTILGGLGFVTSKRSHIETLVSYGKGWLANKSAPPTNKNGGDYSAIGGEIGWYWNFRRHWVCGVAGSAQAYKMKYLDPTATSVDKRSIGIDVMGTLGYRW